MLYSFHDHKKSSQIIVDIKICHLKCFKVKSPNNDKFSCNCTHIKSVDSIKYLGVTFDKYLKWNTHIDIIVKQIRSLFYKFKSLKNILLPTTIRMDFVRLLNLFLVVGFQLGEELILHILKN